MAELRAQDTNVAPKLRAATNDKQRKENAKKLMEWRELRKQNQAEESAARQVEQEKEDAKRLVLEARRKSERERHLVARRAAKQEVRGHRAIVCEEGKKVSVLLCVFALSSHRGGTAPRRSGAKGC